MQFAKKLRDRVRSGDITCTIRIWQKLHVKVGGSYGLPPGRVIIDSIEEIALEQITGEMAMESGFQSVIDLLRTAKHGPGQKVFFIRFHYCDER